MAAAGDWCHFSQRVERTSQHRQLKGGALGYEDEKFSYLIAAKSTVPSKGARIVRHPSKHSGHVQLALCTAEGKLENHTVTRSSKEAYKRARKVEWGDLWIDERN
jgi:ribosomal protein RSM22 (predicted rRNA methylase)